MQSSRFLESEGTAYHRRNRAKYHNPNPQDDIALNLLVKHDVLRPGQRILDVGCGYPWRLAALQQMTGGECYGIDASAAAIAEGKARWPELHLSQGPATGLGYFDMFDGIIMHFLCHWLDRELLLGFAAGVDVALKPSGWLLLADFWPDEPTRVPYKHLDGLWTYKLPAAHSWLWLSGGQYCELGCTIYDHDKHEIGDAPSERRAGCILLVKESQYAD